ncbi:MAG: hypothetical protein IJX28_09290 [Clostridia bacterium]|nr:hypothetical protein [Clostridia bacterium]
MNKPEGRRFGALDFFLFLFLILSVLSLVLRWQWKTPKEESFPTRQITLLATGISPQISDCLKIGDWLYRETGEPFGRVLSKELQEADPSAASLRGQSSELELPGGGLVDLRLEVEIHGAEKEGMLLQNGKHALLYGNAMQLYSDYTALTYWLMKIAD